MGNIKQDSVGTNDGGHEMKDQPVPGKSGSLRRLVILVVIFAIAAGGILGYRQYLEAIIPKGDATIVEEKGQGTEEPEPVPTGMEVLAEMFSAAKPSQEIEELKEKTAKEVVFTYDAIMKMTPVELDENIKEVSGRLETLRKNLKPSIGGASAGSTAPPESSEPDNAPASEEVTVAFLALPLEVMKQISKTK